MGSASVKDDREAVRQLLGRINAAWREGRPEELSKWLHEEVVFVTPGLQARLEGADACIRSYADFLNHAVVQEYQEREPTIDVWGDTAVATYGWTMAWEMDGKSFRESGHDLFVVRRDEGRWRAVWRTILPATNDG
jgi:uncharacterized protein (TIGR02246 family)